MSIRSAASCCQPLHEIAVPRGARTVRGPDFGAVAVTPGSYAGAIQGQGNHNSSKRQITASPAWKVHSYGGGNYTMSVTHRAQLDDTVIHELLAEA
jgi:hypothetical protein